MIEKHFWHEVNAWWTAKFTFTVLVNHECRGRSDFPEANNCKSFQNEINDQWIATSPFGFLLNHECNQDFMKSRLVKMNGWMPRWSIAANDWNEWLIKCDVYFRISSNLITKWSFCLASFTTSLQFIYTYGNYSHSN